MVAVFGTLVFLIGGVVLLVATAPPSPEPDRVIPNEWDTTERSRSFLWGERVAEIKNPAEEAVFAYFVDHGVAGSAIKRAERCVRTELARFTTATCYAFSSETAYGEATLPTQGGEPTGACWTASATGTRESTGKISLESGDNPEPSPSCPV